MFERWDLLVESVYGGELMWCVMVVELRWYRCEGSGVVVWWWCVVGVKEDCWECGVKVMWCDGGVM